MVLLFCSFGSLVEKGDVNLKTQHITLTGLAIILTYCLISALAGVYTEFILKKDLQTSLNLQNMMLYSFTVSLNFGGWFLTQSYAQPTEQGVFLCLVLLPCFKCNLHKYTSKNNLLSDLDRFV